METNSLYKQFSLKGRWFADNSVADDERKLILDANCKYQRQKNLDDSMLLDLRDD